MGGSESAQVKQKVSGPVAAVVIVLAVIIAVAVFNRSSLAPKEKPAYVLPPEPLVEESERATVRSNLAPLGIAAIMPPLIEDRRKGVRVAAIRAGSPAEEAGLEPGDLIDGFDHKPVAHVMNLSSLVNQAEPKRAYPIDIVRGGKRQQLMVTGIVPLPPEERGRL